ncbi:MAG: hypothetical protein MZV70_42325 [Desulfobacterales bacterium]|nr:hypothetical protein [Desulfobacterales bacterium]
MYRAIATVAGPAMMLTVSDFTIPYTRAHRIPDDGKDRGEKPAHGSCPSFVLVLFDHVNPLPNLSL